MDAFEVMISLFVAVVIGALLLSVFGVWDVKGTFNNIRNIVTGDDEQKFAQVNKQEFIAEAIKFWGDCGYGNVGKSLTLYVVNETPGPLLNTTIFAKADALDMQRTINPGTWVVPAEIELPTVVFLRCDVGSRKLIMGVG